MVIVTDVVSATSLATSSTVLPGTACATGSTAELLEKAKKGATPPTTVSVAGVLEYTVAALGSTDSAGGVAGPGVNGLLGAPLPPPHAVSASTPARANMPATRRSDAAIRRCPDMMISLLMLS